MVMQVLTMSQAQIDGLAETERNAIMELVSPLSQTPFEINKVFL
jgi:hypothetical protein